MSKPSRKTQVPCAAYTALAGHYRSRVQHLAQRVVDAMAAGDISEASELYRKGIFAQQNLDHYARIASCIGDLNGPLPSDPEPQT